MHEGVDVDDRPRSATTVSAIQSRQPISVTRRSLPLTGRIDVERRGERDQQEGDAVDLRIDDADDPVQRVGREREAPGATRSRGVRGCPFDPSSAVHTCRSR